MKWMDYQKRLGLNFDDNRKALRFYAQMHNYFDVATSIDFGRSIETVFCNMIGVPIAPNEDPFVLFGDKPYGMQRVWIYLSKRQDNFVDFLSCCVALINSYPKKQKMIKNGLKDVLLNALDDCQIAYDILNDEDGIFIFPKGSKELDDALVSEPLEWLNAYPKSRTAFTKALKAYSEATPDNASSVADKFRKTLETFFQEFFGGGRSLERYVSDHTYEQYLDKCGVPSDMRDEFKNTVNAYAKFINNNAKHHDKTELNVLEYLMYQTGNIIRLLITLKREESKYAD